jgi:hypothetical protein
MEIFSEIIAQNNVSELIPNKTKTCPNFGMLFRKRKISQ